MATQRVRRVSTSKRGQDSTRARSSLSFCNREGADQRPVEPKAKIEAVHRVQAFIEDHLGEPITLLQLAKICRCSPWHTSRIFKEVTGKTPFEYIRDFRLSRAASRLIEDDARVIDIAFDFLFDSHEGFTKAFSRRFGMSPSRFRRLRPPARLFLPPHARTLDLTRRKGEQYMNTPAMQKPAPSGNHQTVFVQVVERPARKLILKRGTAATDYFEYCKEVGCAIWDVLSSVEAATHEPMGMWLPKSLRPEGTSEYVQGVEVPVDHSGPVPEGFEVITLAACQFLIFQGQPFRDEDFEQAVPQLQSAIRAHNPEHHGFQWADEDAPRFQLIPLGYRGYIEGRPIRPLSGKKTS